MYIVRYEYLCPIWQQSAQYVHCSRIFVHILSFSLMANLDADDWIVMLQSILFDSTGTPPPPPGTGIFTLFLADILLFSPNFLTFPCTRFCLFEKLSRVYVKPVSSFDKKKENSSLIFNLLVTNVEEFRNYPLTNHSKNEGILQSFTRGFDRDSWSCILLMQWA